MSQRLQVLFDKYASGQATSEELQEFWQLVAATDDDDEVLSGNLKIWWDNYEEKYNLSAGVDGAKTLKRILAADNQKQIDYSGIHHRPVRRLRQIWAAAVILLLIGTASWYYIQQHSNEPPLAKRSNTVYKNDILPGATGAVLTLADGSQVQLDSAGKDLQLTQGNAKISASNGTVIYSGQGIDTHTTYNTLTTYKGQQYPLRLSDGSLVMLDAGSSITYPVIFTGGKREVLIQGQVWFEIAKDSSQPFIVKYNNKQVQVYGTHFNIKAYDDEPDLRVTLAEGSIKVTSGTVSQMLIPGQQAILSRNDNGIRIDTHADIQETIAWKNGQFEYKSKDLTYVMRDIARWYNIEVVYDGPKPADTFTGGFSRSVTLTELLTILEISRVHFKLEGRKLTVLSR
ncbi:FecR domain-containing protein [Chitinophaga pendula]|uniref:FecR family protein n=1 Tax=Chitinophaga TaxID=79328 RepID=UPI000BB0BB67|nr:MULTISPECIES: FecR family protein [Chitinophaga]ASZ11974.1 iron dicitrate transport regulator FecR [Chitinophaga sp. MD30]UCJ04996.1 FecR domain-containing protein [Chitinophaga pendula]